MSGRDGRGQDFPDQISDRQAIATSQAELALAGGTGLALRRGRRGQAAAVRQRENPVGKLKRFHARKQAAGPGASNGRVWIDRFSGLWDRSSCPAVHGEWRRAILFKPNITTYQLPDGRHRTAHGRRVTKNTPGAVKVTRPSKVWWGRYKAADGSYSKVPLCADKATSKDLLAKLVTDAKLAAQGLSDPFVDPHRRLLSEHRADFAGSLRPAGGTDKHVRLTLSRVRAVLDGCKFTYIRDLNTTAVQAFLASLQAPQAEAIELEPGKESFTKAELVQLTGTNPTGVSALLRRHGLQQTATGQGKARRYPRSTVVYLLERLHQGVGPAMVNHYLGAVKAFAAWLVRDRRTGVNPLAHVAPRNAQTDRRHERRALTLAELQQLLTATRSGGQAFRELSAIDREHLYAVALGTGFRAAELASLVPAAFALDASPPTVLLEAKHAKNRKATSQPLPAGLAEVLRGYLAGHPARKPLWPGYWAEDAADMLRLDLEVAGIPCRDAAGHVIDFHALRHTFITLMAQSGIHPKLAQTLARHSTITLAMDRYAHVQLSEQAAALEALPALVRPAEEHARRFAPRPRLDQKSDGECKLLTASEKRADPASEMEGNPNPVPLKAFDESCALMTASEKATPGRI